MGIFTKFETFFTGKINSLLSTYISAFSSKVIFLLQLGTPILILYYGYSIMTPRGSSASIYDMLFNLVRIGIVFAFVENSGGLLDLAIGFIHELKTGFIGAKSIFALLDEQFLVTQQLSEDVFNLDTDYIKFQGFLAASMIWFGAILVLASSSIVFIAAEVGLALLTVTSPIFVGCLTYGFTRELFNGWLRSIFSCIITLIFATLVVKIGIDISNDIMHQLIVSPEQKSLLTTGATAFITGIVVSSLVLVATKTAGNIAGVAATSAIQGGIMLGAKAGMKTGTSTVGATTKAAKSIGNRIGRGILSKLNKNNSTSGRSQDAINLSTLKEESQKASFARVQQTNSQD